MEIIELNAEQIKFLDPLIEKNRDAQVAFLQASYLLKQTNKEIWDTIKKIFPEKEFLKGDVNWENKEIIIRE